MGGPLARPGAGPGAASPVPQTIRLNAQGQLFITACAAWQFCGLELTYAAAAVSRLEELWG